MASDLVFNRVRGLKFLYENFPYLYDENRIKLYFVKSKNELLNLKFDDKLFDTFVLKRSANKMFVSDIKFKDNRFFDSLNDLKQGTSEFEDIFDFCIECHKFKPGQNYYSDRLAIAQFSTEKVTDSFDRINFIPSVVPGVNTRDNESYLELEYPYDFSAVVHIKTYKQDKIVKNGLDDYSIAYLSKKLHSIVEEVRKKLISLDCENRFQLIFRIDSNLNIIPIDFRTPNAWAKI